MTPSSVPPGAASIDAVGPVLDAGETAAALVAAIRESNPGTIVLDRGSYVRVLVPGRCILSRSAAERALGAPFRLPGDLERVMPSFRGTLSITADEAVWAWRSST